MELPGDPSMAEPTEEGPQQVEDGVPHPPPTTGIDGEHDNNEQNATVAFADAQEQSKEKPKESFMQAASSKALRPFVIISSSYLLFTITDGAIRMIVLLHAYNKSFSALEVALMFTLYELAGVFTNLVRMQ